MAPDSSFKRLVLIAACFYFVPCSSFAATTLAQIEADLARKGGHYVINRYFNRPDAYEGSRLVETGEPAAVALAVKLIPYSDAGSTDEIQGALAEALVKRPAVVLPYVNSGPGLEADHICLPFLSADESKPKLRAIVERTRKSLLHVTADHLQRQKIACSKEVEASLAILH
jgi:hypothetical protein